MTLRIRALRLRVTTTQGIAGAKVTFGEGLNIVRGENSRGKTQVLQGIIYGLGLEAMFGPGANTRLGSALTQTIRLPDVAGAEADVKVLSSWCALEIGNGADVLTAWRPIEYPPLNRNLVRVWDGPLLTAGTGKERGDFFVRESGSVQRATGYHHLLSEFIGWDLPTVARYTGGQVKLYPEMLAPFIYADQRSWGSAAPRPVTQFQVREPTRKAVEFLLALEGPASEMRRFELEEDLSTLKTRWASTREGARGGSALAGARLIGVPELPSGARSGSKSTVGATNLAEADLEVLDAGEWHPAADVATALRGLISSRQLDPQQIPTIEDLGAERLQIDLREAEGELGDVIATTAVLEQNLLLNEAQLGALDRRIDALVEEENRNRDVKTLIRLGSKHADHHLADGSCPTCHQALASVEGGDLGPVLDVDASLRLVQAQLATARGMREQAQSAVVQSRDAYGAFQREADRIRVRIRSTRADLVSPEDAPSSSDIARRIVAESRLDELTRAIEAAGAALQSLQTIADEIARLRSELNALPIGITKSDEQRLSDLTALMHVQLRDFGFDSYAAENVALDPETLRPERSGYDLDADVSASDVVRVKIAYLNAVRELSRQIHAKHPGLLMLDEPRQHEMNEQHFRAALSRLAASGSQGEQVIVTSAASAADLDRMLKGAPALTFELGGQRLLQRETPDPSDPIESSLGRDR